jgi:hypothetical protein
MNSPDLPWPLLEECFPFSFAWDSTGRIVKAGASARRLCPELAQPCALLDVFELRKAAPARTEVPWRAHARPGFAAEIL